MCFHKSKCLMFVISSNQKFDVLHLNVQQAVQHSSTECPTSNCLSLGVQTDLSQEFQSLLKCPTSTDSNVQPVSVP